jgi:hypothetical protein
MDCVLFKVQNEDEENIGDLGLTTKHYHFMSASLQDNIKKHAIFPFARYRLESIVNMLLRCIKLRECRVKHRKAQLNAFMFCDFLEHNHAFQIQL